MVWLTNLPPVTGSTLLTSNCTLCGRNGGDVPAGGIVYMPCPVTLPLFRYVIIQSSLTTNQAICLVEVKVDTSELVSSVFKTQSIIGM